MYSRSPARLFPLKNEVTTTTTRTKKGLMHITNERSQIYKQKTTCLFMRTSSFSPWQKSYFSSSFENDESRSCAKQPRNESTLQQLQHLMFTIRSSFFFVGSDKNCASNLQCESFTVRVNHPYPVCLQKIVSLVSNPKSYFKRFLQIL